MPVHFVLNQDVMTSSPPTKGTNDILYLNSTPGPCDIDSVLDDEMDELECRLIARKQFLVSKQEQEHRTLQQQQQHHVPNNNSPKLLVSSKSSIPKVKLVRGDTGSTCMSTISIRTSSPTFLYDTADILSEVSEAKTTNDAELVTSALKQEGEGSSDLKCCSSLSNVEKDDEQPTSCGPVDVDEFIPQDSMYFEQDYGDWFILDEIEISRGLAGYEVGFEPETIWSFELDTSTLCPKKKSRNKLTPIYEGNVGCNGTKRRGKPKLYRNRSNNT
jgi:hypothetical protein